MLPRKDSTAKVILRLPQDEKAANLNPLILEMQTKFPAHSAYTIQKDIRETAKYLSLDDAKILLNEITKWKQLTDFNGILHSLSFRHKLDELYSVFVANFKTIIHEMGRAELGVHPLHSACLSLHRIQKLEKEILTLLLSERKFWGNITGIASALESLSDNNLYTKDNVEFIFEFPDNAFEVSICILITYKMTEPQIGGNNNIGKEEYYTQLRQQLLNNKSAAECHIHLINYLNEKENETVSNRTCIIL